MRGSIPNGEMNGGAFFNKCYIDIIGPNFNETIQMQSLPDINDGKGASYGDETAIGRATPFKTYSQSDNRTVGWTAHFMITAESDVSILWRYIRAIQAATYPFDGREGSLNGAPYAPPPICRLQCGDLLSKNGPLNAVMKSYSIKFDTSVPWHEETFLPYKFDIDMQFDIIYDQSYLPNASKILQD
ncbi:MAG: hypothetical protein EB127_21215 [Alphaproteobacteria bacterium]|nr:hypothetical protein [Alphaproteobacteria bacterium]